ncbi:hypothetical protein SAMN04487907_101823 [Zunongwangia mangrovi]|uniref:Uncharacterized protein n=1 Tax=Zunongwangia mangrovi TaxID=1334022 RepID=A0A1I1EDC7_9FLAO|nr:hypothetical protein [Zunongwangia mangrovi]SFB82980.1 hypothetical protein SAMN04487907_101823 [Zunongwangia mangrovi]
MKNFKHLFLAGLTTITLASCSDDDDAMIETDDGMEVDAPMLFATTHSGNIAGYNLDTGDSYTVSSDANDAEGIIYDDDADALIVASRDPLEIQSYSDVSMWDDMSNEAMADFTSSSDVMSPRDIAVSNDMVVIADNADTNGDDDDTPNGRFFIYTRTADGMTLRNTVMVDFNVWGIEFVGNTLYAVVDQTNMLASFDNFLSNSGDGMVDATKMIALEGIVRTHGLDYDDGTMIMSDIGSADSDSDGALHVIMDFDDKFNDTEDGATLAVEEQVRIAGASTMLGNPVNVSYDEDSGMIYVAELANGGGRVLAFSDEDSGDATPAINNMLSGVSAVYFED